MLSNVSMLDRGQCPCLYRSPFPDLNLGQVWLRGGRLHYAYCTNTRPWWAVKRKKGKNYVFPGPLCQLTGVNHPNREQPDHNQHSVQSVRVGWKSLNLKGPTVGIAYESAWAWKWKSPNTIGNPFKFLFVWGWRRKSLKLKGRTIGISCKFLRVWEWWWKFVILKGHTIGISCKFLRVWVRRWKSLILKGVIMWI